MLKKLRLKFILLSMVALLVLLTFVIAGMNIMNYNSLIKEADDTLNFLAENGGIFPEFKLEMKVERPPFMSPEAPYETRFFSVLFDADLNVLYVDTEKIKAVDYTQAANYARQVLNTDKELGFIENYRFLRRTDSNLTRIIFLDCGRKLNDFYGFLYASINMAIIGYVLFFVAILFFSKRIVAPVAESYEKQKRFITDASHEIKTPLTIIQADADVIEMEQGDNEWLTDIKNQTQRLVGLTNDLVYLTRMEETRVETVTIEFPLSDITSETAAAFLTAARTKNITLDIDVQPMLEMRGNEKEIIQLTNILLDNALKYTPEGGGIKLSLERRGKNIQLEVSNTIKDPISEESLKQMFDRFYRIDASRSTDTGGYGIGLSIAKAIAEAHGAKISAHILKENTFAVTVAFAS